MFRVLFLLILLAVASVAETAVWRVAHAGKVLYIGGTVHMLHGADYPLPDAFERAFDAADVLVFETDMGAMASPQTAMRMQAMLMYGPPDSLQNHLKRKTYAALSAYAAQNRLPMQMLDLMKPQMVVMTIMNLELQRLGMTAPGVDAYYFGRAAKAGKSVTWFESVDDQIAMIAALGQEDPDTMLLENLEEVNDYAIVLQQMLDAWRSGDMRQLYRLGKKYLVNESPEDFRRLITERNRRWMQQLGPMLRSRETEFVLVGALHLAGPEGIIAQLRRRGYRVEQL